MLRGYPFALKVVWTSHDLTVTYTFVKNVDRYHLRMRYCLAGHKIADIILAIHDLRASTEGQQMH